MDILFSILSYYFDEKLYLISNEILSLIIIDIIKYYTKVNYN
jgi:hypothetical protein